MRASYHDLKALIELVDEPNRTILTHMYGDHKQAFHNASGASKNHQVWPGGYVDHITEAMNIAATLYDTLNAARPLPFSKSDALLVLFLHDLEKPFRYSYADDKLVIESSLASKVAKAAKRHELIAQYKIELTDQQANAMKYVEGVPESDYTPNKRIMGELAAFCHCADTLSARLWYDYPLADDDPWVGAHRASV